MTAAPPIPAASDATMGAMKHGETVNTAAPSKDAVIVRRRKSGPYGGPKTIHYVREFNDAGHVLALTELRVQAARMTRAEAEKILEHKNGRLNAGDWDILKP